MTNWDIAFRIIGGSSFLIIPLLGRWGKIQIEKISKELEQTSSNFSDLHSND